MINRRDLAKGLGLGGLMLGAGTMGTAASARARRAGAAPVIAQPAGPWSRTASLRRAGGQLHYAVLGAQDSPLPPVILLHKLGGWLSDWRMVAPALAEGRKVIAFDLPGHGGSRWDGAPPYIHTLAETAALLIGALDELGIEQVDVLGTSLGGCVGVMLAAFWPERVRRLAVISSALGPRRTLAEVKVVVDEKQKAMFDATGLPLPMPAEALTAVFGMVNTGPINADGALSRQAAGRWIQPSERGVGVTDLKAALRRIEAPTLLLYGQFDKAYFRFRADAEAALRNGRSEVVPNSGAWVIQDNPAATGPILARFIA
jgi:pimeloyl-ACP methyl ester carboxylesterase